MKKRKYSIKLGQFLIYMQFGIFTLARHVVAAIGCGVVMSSIIAVCVFIPTIAYPIYLLGKMEKSLDYK